MNKLLTFAAGGTLLAASMGASAAMMSPTNAYFQYSDGQAGITTSNDRHIDANAYDGDTNTFRSLGLGGMGVFEFDPAFGSDATVWEVTFDCGGSGSTCSGYQEGIEVYAGNSWDGDFTSQAGWTSLGTIYNGDAQSGATVAAGGPFKYLFLVDISASLGNKSLDGFDVGEVRASPVPVPAALPLFMSALAGLGFMGFRRRSA